MSASAISDYLSDLRAYRSLQESCNLWIADSNLHLPKQLRQMRREDGPAGQRALSRGLTARVLRRLLSRQVVFERDTRRGPLRWAVLWTAHNLLLLRGGEPGRVDSRRFDPAAGMTIANVDWVAPCEDTGGYEVAVIEVMPIKDTRVSRATVPLVVRRRAQGIFTGACDSSTPCAWDALSSFWDLRTRECSCNMWGTMPLYAMGDGSPVCTSDVLCFVRVAALAAACEPAQFDSHSLRIGGATNLPHQFGAADAERIIQKRGRWCSLIHQIYSRMSAYAMMEVSARMLDADGVDMEAFRHSYVMPATCLRR